MNPHVRIPPVGALSVAEFLQVHPDLPLVTAIVSKPFPLRLDAEHSFAVLMIQEGTQPLPDFVAAHWFSKANGVTVYEPDAALAASAPTPRSARKRGAGA
jgi:hypothetical protein